MKHKPVGYEEQDRIKLKNWWAQKRIEWLSVNYDYSQHLYTPWLLCVFSCLDGGLNPRPSSYQHTADWRARPLGHRSLWWNPKNSTVYIYIYIYGTTVISAWCHACVHNTPTVLIAADCPTKTTTAFIQSHPVAWRKDFTGDATAKFRRYLLRICNFHYQYSLFQIWKSNGNRKVWTLLALRNCFVASYVNS